MIALINTGKYARRCLLTSARLSILLSSAKQLTLLAKVLKRTLTVISEGQRLPNRNLKLLKRMQTPTRFPSGRFSLCSCARDCKLLTQLQVTIRAVTHNKSSSNMRSLMRG
jgi:hypothetical protein